MIALSEGRDDAAPGSNPGSDPGIRPGDDLGVKIPAGLAQSPVVRAADALARAILRGGGHQAETRAYEQALIDLQATFAQNLLELKLEQSAPDTPRRHPAATNQN